MLEHREVGRFGRDLVVLHGGGCGVGVGFRGCEGGLLGGDFVENFLLVKLREHFALVDRSVDVGIQLRDDARSLGLHLNLLNRLHLARGDDGTRNITGFDGANLRRVELG